MGLSWEVSPTGDKGVDAPLPTLFGMELGNVGRKSQFVLDSNPCQVVDLFKREEASLCTPLSSYSPAAVGKSGHLKSKYLDWVVQRAKEIHVLWGFHVWAIRNSLWQF